MNNIMNNITFFILRHVNNKISNNYWKICYYSIRKYYNNKIIIIDDNSDLNYVDNIETINTKIIQSEFKGSGELLPYYYFHKLKPSSKMIFLHDSMLLINKLNEKKIKNINTYSYLFYFDIFKFDHINMVTIKEKLKIIGNKNLSKIFDENKWYGCFGVSSIITLNFIEKIQKKFNLFKLLNYVKTRTDRMDIERIFSLMCYELTKQNNYYIDCIFNMPSAFWTCYENHTVLINLWKQKSPIMKYWCSR